MRFSSSWTRWSLGAAAVAAVALLAAWMFSGGAMLSPGALHAGGEGDVALGGVASHAELAGRCSACHAPPVGAERMADRCLTCHVEVRAEMADTTRLHGVLPDAARCVHCHVEHRGPRAVLTVFSGQGFAHERLGFSLAAHRRTPEGAAFTCTTCHARETFRFAEGGCATCHAGYQAAFVSTHVDDWGSDCAACHDGRDRFSAFRHDTVRFRLTGRHVPQRCTACHAPVRAFAAFANAPATCVGCHRDDDEHRGRMGPSCGTCHNTVDWEDADDDDRGRDREDRGRDRGGRGRGRRDRALSETSPARVALAGVPPVNGWRPWMDRGHTRQP